MVSIPELGGFLCIALIVAALIFFFIIWLVFKFIIYFFPSIIVAALVYFITNNLGWTLAAFIISAIIFSIWGYNRKRSHQNPPR